MTLKTTVILAGLSLALLPLSRAEDQTVTDDILLRGVLDLGDTVNFSLSSPGGQRNDWAAVGDSFLGYEIIEYKPDEKMLVVTKDGQEFLVGLAGMSASSVPTDMEKAKQEAADLFRNIRFEETISKIMDSQMEAMSQAMRQQMAAMGEVDEEALAYQQKLMSGMMKKIDWKAMQLGMETAYAEVFTTSELRGMNDFYATPAGQATIDKAPQLQTKTMEIMMPEIMRVSTEMQKEMMEYVTEETETEETP